MGSVATELIILVVMLLANGFFALAEIAVVSARKARLRQLAERGNKRAAIALAAATQPTRFLSAVQVGITLITIVTGVFGGETIAERLAAWLAGVEWLEWMAAYSRQVALAVVVVGLTLCSIVFGELVPKRFALAFPERLSMLVVPVVNKFAVVVAPVVALLTWFTELILRAVGLHKTPREAPVSEEEVNTLIEQGLHEGVFNKTEKEMVASVLDLDKCAVTRLMTPRAKIVFLNIDDSDEANWRKIVASGHSYFPVCQGGPDQVLGLVAVKALWAHAAIGLPGALKNLLVAPLIVPETMMAIQLLEAFKKSGKHLALVTDEFGAIQGLATLIDVLEAIVGDLPDEQNARSRTPAATRREDGAWLIDATLPTRELKTLLSLKTLPDENAADFQTLGGFVMTQFGRIPSAGEHFDHDGWRFEVTGMDRHRVDKMLVRKTKPPAAKPAPANPDQNRFEST